MSQVWKGGGLLREAAALGERLPVLGPLQEEKVKDTPFFRLCCVLGVPWGGLRRGCAICDLQRPPGPHHRKAV